MKRPGTAIQTTPNFSGSRQILIKTDIQIRDRYTDNVYQGYRDRTSDKKLFKAYLSTA